MRTEFGSVDTDQWRTWLIGEMWNELPGSFYAARLHQCSDCVQSTIQFLQVRDVLDYHLHPCFHVAYYSSDRCLEVTHGMYSIITDRVKLEGIVIAFCPWCGTALPIGIGREP